MKARKVLSKPASTAIVLHYILGYGLLYPAIINWWQTLTRIHYQTRMMVNTGIYVFVFLVTVIPALPVLKYGWEKLTDSYGRKQLH